MLSTKGLFRMALFSTPTKIEKVPSPSCSDKEASSKVGIKVLQACSKEKKLLLFVRLIMPMAPEDLHLKFPPILL